MLSAISYNLAYLQAPQASNTVPTLIKALDAKRSELSGDELANIVMTLAIWNHKPESRCAAVETNPASLYVEFMQH